MSAPTTAQSFDRHARWVPGYHLVTGSLTVIVFGWTLYRLATQRSADALLGATLGFVVLAQFFYLRAFPLAVQDRLIRLEERLRLERLLPAEMKATIPQFTANQLIGMRFASDGELPAIAKKVFEGRIGKRKEVKALVVNWRGDHMRA